LVLDSAVLRLGPIVAPGGGGCWNCWARRSRQHAAWPNEQSALAQHYASQPDSGPKGFLEPFAMMGAARIGYAIEALDSSTPIGGYVWQIDLITRKVTTSTVVGIHDCRRCGLHRPAATRSFAEMQQTLAYLWTNPVSEER
jgi:bacteriocin biosynthesis cyclodehydratase domain-containing protein